MRTLHFRHYILILLTTLLLCGFHSTVEAQVSVRLSKKTIQMGGKKYLIHKVKKGENLYSIAKAYTVSESEIIRANNLTRSVVRKRQVLLIPEPKRPVPQMERITPSIPPQTITPDTNEGRIPSHDNNFATPSLETETTQSPPAQPKIQLRDFDRTAPLNIAVLLPLQVGMRNNDNFTAFYNGILLGAGEMKKRGISTNIRFMNSGASEYKVQELIENGALDNANLIIGPVYAKAFEPVAEYIASQPGGGVPIISPLGMVGSSDNPYVYEAPAAEINSFEYIFNVFGGAVGSLSSDANIIVIDHIEHPDTMTLSLIESRLGDKLSSLSFTGDRSQSNTMKTNLNAVLDKDRENIIYVPIKRADAVEGVLSHLSSINYHGKYRITVIGTPRWAWLPTINLDLFFKLNVHYPASYHANRSNPAVAEFYRTYIESFGSIPNLYSFRGYDVVRYFGEALHQFGTQMPTHIVDGNYNPILLQVGYEYRQIYSFDGGMGKYRNVAWPVVNYKPDFTIEIKQ